MHALVATYDGRRTVGAIQWYDGAEVSFLFVRVQVWLASSFAALGLAHKWHSTNEFRLAHLHKFVVNERRANACAGNAFKTVATAAVGGRRHWRRRRRRLQSWHWQSSCRFSYFTQLAACVDCVERDRFCGHNGQSAAAASKSTNSTSSHAGELWCVT